ncbi:MAG: hypothetical protein JWQ02_4291 [Capsulimonas sp.]|nr:hypothetical protein [Capsulimonas sp.]
MLRIIPEKEINEGKCMTVQATRKAAPLLALAALTALSLTPAHGQTVITGSHDNTAGSGDFVSNGAYVVPADSGAPSATFNNNQFSGLVTFNADLTVNGGQFNGNGSYGLYVFTGNAAINGGEFNNNGDTGVIFTNTSTGAVSGAISGGDFAGNRVGVDAENSASVNVSGGAFTGNSFAAVTSFTGSGVTVTGGQFQGNGFDFYASNGNTTEFPAGGIDIYGRFIDPSTGKLLAAGQTYSLTGVGSFTGSLATNTSVQTYTYQNYGASITLHGLAAPEPAQNVALMLGALGLAGLVFTARRRKSMA